MGAPTSIFFLLKYTKYLEQHSIIKILNKQQIKAYVWYVDILIVYNTIKLLTSILLSLFNQLHPQLQFTLELEDNNRLNFLDLTFHRRHDHISASIFQKPTATGTLIHYESCHPNEHKFAGHNFLVNRIVAYPMPHSEMEKEASIS
jgi:hypothetical protein